MDWDKLPKEFQNIIVLAVFIAVLFAINFVINVGTFFTENPLYLWLTIGIIGLIGAVKFLGPSFLVSSHDKVKTESDFDSSDIGIPEEILEQVTVDERLTIVNSIGKEINQWKKYAPKIRGRGKESKLTISMTAFLAKEYPKIVLEQRLGGNRIDAVIGKIGIEAKHRPNQNEINRLYGQVDDYLRYLDHIVVVFFDTNQSMINNFNRKLKSGNYINKVSVFSV